ISSTQVSVCDTKEQPPPPALRPSPSAPGLGLGPVRALRGGVNSPAACPSGVSDQESGVSRLLFLRGFLNLDAWVFLQRLERLPELGGFLLFTSRIVQVDKPLNQIGELVLADWRQGFPVFVERLITTEQQLLGLGVFFLAHKRGRQQRFHEWHLR